MKPGAAPEPPPGRPIDVLHLRACNFVGGPERQLLRYAAHEAQGPWRVALATFVDRREGEGRQLLAAAEAAGIEALALPGGGWADARGLAQLLRLLRRRQVRLLCTHAYRADLIGELAARGCRIPTAWFLRGWTGEDRKVRAFEVLDRAGLRFASRVVCLSEMQRQRIQARGIAAARLRVVPNAVEAPPAPPLAARRQLCARFGLDPAGLLVGAAGRLSPEKGAADLIAALALVHPAAQILLFGEGPLRSQLEAAVQQHGLPQVRLVGFHPDFPNLLPGLDLLVNPSHREEMPNVVLEAMAAGVPVLATAVGGVAEIAGDPPALVLVPPAAPALLAQALETLLQDAVARQRLAAAGPARIAAAYSGAHQRQCLRALYAELARPHPA